MATKLPSALKPRKKGLSPQKNKKKKSKALSEAEQASSADKRVARALVYPSEELAEDADEDDVEEMLRQFDLDTKFGPCLGLSRLDRWERAQRHGLCPPHNIKALLERVGGQPNSLWEGRV